MIDRSKHKGYQKLPTKRYLKRTNQILINGP